MKSSRLHIQTNSRMKTPRSIIVLSKSFFAFTSNYNVMIKDYYWTSKSIEMERNKHFYSTIKRGSFMGIWYQKVALRSHLSKIASDMPTFGNFWTSFRTRYWFHYLNQKTFCSLLTWEETKSYSFYVIISRSGFIIVVTYSQFDSNIRVFYVFLGFFKNTWKYLIQRPIFKPLYFYNVFLKILENTSFWAPLKNTRISYVTTMGFIINLAF
jgi:hypothetical protein